MARPDSIVVGAGVVGLAVGCELARLGQQVLVLERGRPGDGASGVGGGFVSLQTQQAPALVSLVRESQRRYHDLGDRLGADIGLRQCGSLALAVDESEAQLLAARCTALQASGVAAEVIDGATAREGEPLVGPRVSAALVIARDLQVDPWRLLQAYRADLARRGSETRLDRLVVGLRRSDGRVSGVRTQYGDLDADNVILATGCWTAVLLPPSYATFVRPRRGQVLVARPRRRCVQHLLCGTDYFASKFGGETLGCALEQTVDGVVRLGSSREWSGYDSRPTALTQAIVANAARWLALPDDLEWWHATAGLRPATPDGLPLIGAIERGLWLVSGHEGSGFATAPATAARVAAAVTGQQVDLRAFQPGRFMTPPEGSVAGT